MESPDQIGSLSRGALRHDVVSRLVKAIFQGELAAGTRLVVQKLADRFGISSTPVREALVELEAVGVVQFMHNRGALVKPFGPQQLRDLFHLRRILEAEVTRCACGRLEREPLLALQAEMRELAVGDGGAEWSRQKMASDRRLHELIVSGCENARLAHEIGRYNTLFQAIREIAGNRRHLQERALDEHLAVIDALLAEDPELAALQMARHITSAGGGVEAVMFNSE